jgi:hypothetical protein
MFPSEKCVNFAPEEDLVSVCVFDNSTFDSSMYVSNEEFHKSKEESFVAVSLAREQGFSDQLEGTFIKPAEDVQKRLNRFVRKSDYRGVERYICESHLEERKLYREHAIRAVLIGQEMGRQQGLDADELAEQLRKVALLYSVDAKIFARRLGKADESACCQKKHHDHCRHDKNSPRSKRAATRKPSCNPLKPAGRLVMVH